MGKYAKTLYRVTLKSEREGKQPLIFEMRSIKTAAAFERILQLARLPVDIVPAEERVRNPQGSYRYTQGEFKPRKKPRS